VRRLQEHRCRRGRGRHRDRWRRQQQQASNNKVDEIRELRSNTQYRPARSRFKIYIIDEVHMLSTSAFNALLKTLEEPPPHVKFIFATTEVQKIPVTILSRCQRFDFAGIEVGRITERLRDIVKREGMQADDDALEMIARRAGGSMRDAQSLLDQLLAFGGERLTADQVHALLGTAGDDRVAELAGAVLEHDAKKAIDQLGELAQKTLQPGELLDQLMAYWRDLMVAHVAGEQSKHLSVPARQREILFRQAKTLSLDTILAGLDVLGAARMRLRGSSHGRTLVEMVLVRLARLEDLTPVSQLAQLLSQTSLESEKKQPLARPRPASPPEGIKKKLTEEAVNGEQKSIIPLSEATIAEIWCCLLQELPRLHGSDLEKAGLPAISGPNSLVLRFPPAYNAAREYCQDATRVERMESVLGKLTGQAWHVRVEAGSGGETGSATPTSPTVPTVPEESGLLRLRRLREAAEQEPTIRRAIEVLGAQVLKVDELFNSTEAASSQPSAVPTEAGNDVSVDAEEM
jgi:DNA polymerase-3 subunit gamma/tau